MVLLSISDFHVSSSADTDFTNLVHSFCMYLEKFFYENPDWKPDFICVNGDIAGKGIRDEFLLGGKYIRQIAEKCEVAEDYVLFAPGNHDMTFSVKLGETKKLKSTGESKFVCSKEYNGFIKKYIAEFNSFDKKKNLKLPSLEEVFKEYSFFRSSFLHKAKYYSLLSHESLKFTTGIRVFDNYQIVFLELNNTWLSFPKKPEYWYQLRFGSWLIAQYMVEIEKYKNKGYFVVALFHHPFRYLDHAEYQSSGNNYCPYDAIIKMADICLSGHEHGPESKRIDCLGNMSQYLLNGGFYSPTETNTDSSAVLIKIDKEKEHILTRQLCCKKRTYPEWRTEAVVRYRLASAFYHKLVRDSIADYDLQYKVIPCKKEIDEDLLKNKIIEAYFGKSYKLIPEVSDLYLLSKDQSSTNQGKICFIDIDSLLEAEIKYGTYPLKWEVLCKASKEKPLFIICFRPQGEYCSLNERYVKLKTIYRELILQSKLVFLLAIIEKN